MNPSKRCLLFQSRVCTERVGLGVTGCDNSFISVALCSCKNIKKKTQLGGEFLYFYETF